MSASSKSRKYELMRRNLRSQEGRKPIKGVSKSRLYEKLYSALLHSFADAVEHLRASLPKGQRPECLFIISCHCGELFSWALILWPFGSAPCVELNMPLLPEKAKVPRSGSKKSLVYIEIVNAKGMGQGSDSACNTPLKTI